MDQRPTYEELEKQINALQIENDEMRKAKQAIEESQSLHPIILENISDVLIVTDDHSKIIYASPNVNMIFGLSQNQVYELGTIQALINGNACDLPELRKVQEIPNIEWTVVDQSGKERLLLITAKLLSIEDGTFLYIMRDISERKLAQDALREKQNQLLEAQHIAHIGNWWHDLVKGEIYWSDEFFNIIGLEPQKPTPELDLSLIHPEDLHILQHAMDESAAGKEEQEHEFRIIRPDGGIRWIHNRWVGIYNEAGKEIKRVGTHQDITDRKLAEEALRINEKRYRSLFEDSRDAVYIVTKEGKFVDANQAFLNLFGYSRDELPGIKAQDIHVNPVMRPGILEKLDQEGSIQNYEVKFKKKDGTVLDCLLTTTVRLAEDGTILGYQGIVRDVTDRIRTEESLKEREEKYRNILESISEGYFETDKRAKFVFFNDSFCEIMGYPRDELQGMTNDQTMDEKNLEKLREASKEMLKSGGIGVVTDFQIIRKDGERRHLESSLSAMKNPEGELLGFRGIVRDVTERKLMEEMLIASKEAAEEANRAKSEFLANMSHEIRTPMNAIMGMTQLALETELDEETREYMETVWASADSLLNIINDILDFSKIESKKLELDLMPFELADTLGDSLKSLAIRAHEKGLELAYHGFGDDIPRRLIGDAGRLRQIVVNLTGNAIKFTEKGEVVLGVKREKDVDNRICLHFSVTDTGMGIPRDRQKTIFEAFSQADGSTTRKYGGTGLGLTISKHLVEMMGGRIWVESPSKWGLEGIKSKTGAPGCTFHFTALFDPEPMEAKEVLPEVPVDIKEIPVLIVDDNATNRRILTKVSTNWGMKPTAVDGGEKALVALEEAVEKGEPFELILLDAMMPEMDGFDLAAEIGKRPGIAGTVIMMLTSSGQRGDAARCRNLGISAYLTKPIKQSDLLDAIMTVLSQKSQAKERGALVTRHSLREDQAPPPPRATGAPMQILVAEDNPTNQRLVSLMLEKRGHTVTLADDGRKALAALDKRSFDVVLMDVQMPEMDGFEATRAIREKEDKKGGHIPIIALTAHAMKGDRERCLEAGMDGYVSKPIQIKELLKAIDSLISPTAAQPGA